MPTRMKLALHEIKEAVSGHGWLLEFLHLSLPFSFPSPSIKEHDDRKYFSLPLLHCMLLGKKCHLHKEYSKSSLVVKTSIKTKGELSKNKRSKLLHQPLQGLQVSRGTERQTLSQSSKWKYSENHYDYFRELDYLWWRDKTNLSLLIFLSKTSELGKTWIWRIIDAIMTNRVTCWIFSQYTSLEDIIYLGCHI